MLLLLLLPLAMIGYSEGGVGDGGGKKEHEYGRILSLRA